MKNTGVNLKKAEVDDPSEEGLLEHKHWEGFWG
jgi:hypothetical protein